MTKPERMAAMKGLIAEHERDRNILRPTHSRLRWLAQAVPLLSFSPILHENAMIAADILARPKFSSTTYEQMEARILLCVRQGITELEHGLTPEEQPEQTMLILADEHGPWWFFQNCTPKIRWWMLTVCFTILSAVLVLTYRLGRADFFHALTSSSSTIRKP